MASYTTNLNLKKPAGSENVAIGDINNNMDIIDNAHGTLNSTINKVLIPANASDANDKKDTGMFSTTSSTTNTPYAGYFLLYVYKYSNNDAAQIAIDINNNKVFSRTWHDGTTWTAWRPLTEIKSESGSGNTDSGGNRMFKSGKYANVVFASFPGYIAIPFHYNSNTYIKILDFTTLSPIASTSVTGTVYYLDE